MISAERELAVEFFDVDSMGIVWNGRYFDYFEIVRHALFIKAGFEYSDMYAQGFMLPIVKNKCKYIKPLRLGGMYIVKAVVTECDLLLKLSFTIRDKGTGILMTKAESVQLAVNLQGESLGRLPETFSESLRSLDA